MEGGAYVEWAEFTVSSCPFHGDLEVSIQLHVMIGLALTPIAIFFAAAQRRRRGRAWCAVRARLWRHASLQGPAFWQETSTHTRMETACGCMSTSAA